MSSSYEAPELEWSEKLRAEEGPKEHTRHPEAAQAAGFKAHVAGAYAAGSTVYVSFRGELDLAVLERARACFELATRRAPALVVADLTSLDFMDVSGLSLLLAERKRASAQARRFLVVAPEGTPARRLLRLAGVEEWLGVVEEPPIPPATGEPGAATRAGANSPNSSKGAGLAGVSEEQAPLDDQA